MKKTMLMIAVTGVMAISTIQVFGTSTGPAAQYLPGQIFKKVVPVVNLSDPADKAKDVAIDKILSVTFNCVMDPLSINQSTFTLKQGDTEVAGKVGFEGYKITFSPKENLKAGMEYTATVSTDAKSTGGQPLAANFVFTFTTAGAPAAPAPPTAPGIHPESK